MTAFLLHQQSWIAGTEPAWPAESKIFVIWPYTENVCQPFHKETVKETLVDFTFRMSPPTSCSHSHAISSSLITETPQQTIVFTSYSENKDKSFRGGNNNLSFPRSASASLPVKLKAMLHSQVCVYHFPQLNSEDSSGLLFTIKNSVRRRKKKNSWLAKMNLH